MNNTCERHPAQDASVPHGQSLRNRDANLFSEKNGLYIRRTGVSHRNDEYDSHLFGLLAEMQRMHFWYSGRHRFLLAALRDLLKDGKLDPGMMSAIDLGAGCGGWVAYLKERDVLRFGELAVADSSEKALDIAGKVLGHGVERFQADLFDMGWNERWDIVFLLDVLEHIPDHLEALQRVRSCLKPGGLLFITAPALMGFWSSNDTMAGHLRRYSRADLRALSKESGLETVMTRYFMFLLSPFLILSRLSAPGNEELSREETWERLVRTHRIPPGPVNTLLKCLFSLETPLGLRIPFPWGTSVLGVFRNPAD
jgi:SAM-dependent methyltransferase